MTHATITIDQLPSDAAEAPILDVRTPAEFSTSRIPDAVNIPLDVLDQRAGEVADAVTGPVVLVCSSGQRAAQAQQRLADAGVEDARVLDGGMQAWQAADRPVEGEQAKWGLERQVRLVAGSVVLSSILASVVWPPARYAAGLIGGGLTFSAVTNTCGMARVLSKLPYNRGSGVDPEEALGALGR